MFHPLPIPPTAGLPPQGGGGGNLKHTFNGTPRMFLAAPFCAPTHHDVGAIFRFLPIPNAITGLD